MRNNFLISAPIPCHSSPHPAPRKGAFRDRHDARGGERWPRPGVPDVHPSRRPKPQGSGAPAARHSGLLGSTPYRGLRPPGAAKPGKRWRVPEDRERAREPERGGHRGSGGASLQRRARDAGETADLRLLTSGRGQKLRPAPWPRGLGARGSFGTPAFRAPFWGEANGPRAHQSRVCPSLAVAA